MPQLPPPIVPQFLHFTGLKTRPWINLAWVWRIERLPMGDGPKGFVLHFANGEAPLNIIDAGDVYDLTQLLDPDEPETPEE